MTPLLFSSCFHLLRFLFLPSTPFFPLSPPLSTFSSLTYLQFSILRIILPAFTLFDSCFHVFLSHLPLLSISPTHSSSSYFYSLLLSFLLLSVPSSYTFTSSCLFYCPCFHTYFFLLLLPPPFSCPHLPLNLFSLPPTLSPPTVFFSSSSCFLLHLSS